MPKLKLTYFDFHGGRGEAARLAMTIGGIEFEDYRIKFESWPTAQTEMPFRAIPVLEVDGTVITQSNTINRFVGKLTRLYPDEPWQATLCDEVMDAVEDIVCNIVTTFSIADEEEKKRARKALASGSIPLYLTRFQTYLQDRGGEYFADNRLTIADLTVFVWVRGLRSGHLDHIPADLVDRTAPLLVEHSQRLSDHPKLIAYYGKS